MTFPCNLAIVHLNDLGGASSQLFEDLSLLPTYSLDYKCCEALTKHILNYLLKKIFFREIPPTKGIEPGTFRSQVHHSTN